MSNYHIPVMVKEVLSGLSILPGTWYVDATVGGGGHALEMLKAGANVLGIDQDQDALDETSLRLAESTIPNLDTRVQLVKANFGDLSEVIRHHITQPISGILFDLGVSSHQLDDLDRGFSFDSPLLDMRMDPSIGKTAADLVAQLSETDLSSLFVELGEERYAKRFAQAIVVTRRRQPISSGKQLADIIAQASPPSYRYGRIHPATRVFQALRMAVNAELTVLPIALQQAQDVLAPGGRIAVISFHSLEDRLVKQFFASTSDLVIEFKKPIVASSDEIQTNPRSRSAKLRIAQKVH